VQASGFAGNESLVVLECGANGKATTISVTQAVPQPTQEADEHISFG
jgi:hypothetical protein